MWRVVEGGGWGGGTVVCGVGIGKAYRGVGLRPSLPLSCLNSFPCTPCLWMLVWLVYWTAVVPPPHLIRRVQV